MSLNVTFNGSLYIIPETGEVGWGGNTTSYLVAIAAGALQKTGGSFTLSADTDFGASFGLMSLYYKSRSSNLATSGVLRLNNNSDSISWRNAANSADLPLVVNASDELLYNGNQVLTGTGPSSYVSSITGTANQVIASASTGPVTLSLPQNIATSSTVQFGTEGLGSTTVASSILSLTSTTLGFLPPRMTTAERDLISSPATGLFIYNTSTGVNNYYNGTLWVAIAAGGTINAGTQFQLAYYAADGTTLSGLTLITALKALASDTNGLPVASTTTATELGYVAGVTSAIQTQLDTKATDTLVVHLAGTETITGQKTFNAPVILSSGTQALPSLTFTGDTDTGIYSVGAGQVSITGDNNLIMNFSIAQSNLYINSSSKFQWEATTYFPNTNNAIDLGTTAMNWRSLYISTSIKNGSTTLATVTELGYLTGVTSAIQTQLDGKVTLTTTQSITGAKTFDSSTILIKETGGGTDTITLVTPSLAASRSYTLPDAGTAASFVMTEGTQTINGSKTISALIGTLSANLVAASNKVTGLAAATANGDAVRFEQLKVLQVVNATFNTSDSGTSSSTFQASFLTASITPTSSSNKILIIISSNIQNNAAASTDALYSIFRSTTNLTTNYMARLSTSTAISTMRMPMTLTWLDSPATTSSTTYTLYFRSTDNTTTVRVGDTGSSASSITLIEVAP